MRPHLILLATTLAGSAAALADQPAVHILDDLVVTATRLPQPPGDTLQHTTVIGEREIRASGATDIPTLLRQQAGIEITQQGGPGSQGSLFMRGTNSNHTLVLLDGVRIGSVSTGATALDQILLDDIERIEIVRGNVSSVYGSEAIGGVIQLFTRRGQGQPATRLRAGLGGYGAHSLSASHAGQTGNTSYRLGLSQHEQEGFSAARREFVPASADPWAAFTPADTDRDGYRNRTFSLNVEHAYAPGQRVGLLARHSQGRVEYDGAWQNQSDQTLGHLAFQANNRLSKRWQSHLSLSRSVDRLDNALDGTATGHVHSRTRQLEWLHEFSLAPGQNASLGLGHVQQGLSSDQSYDRTRRDIASLSLGYLGHHGRHSLQVNGRHDDYSDFGAHNTALIGYGFELTPRWKAIASLSTAFRAPSFNELYNPAWGGNPVLKPEKARSRELGLHHDAGPWQTRLTHFDNRIKDLITYAWPTGNQNLQRARIDGWEWSLSGRFTEYTLRASLNLQDPVNASTGQALLRRARRFGSVSLEREYGRLDLRLEWKATSARPDIHVATFSPTRTPGYSVWNLSGAYRLNPDASLEFRIENLFDKDYSLVHGYDTPGRNLFAAIHWRL